MSEPLLEIRNLKIDFRQDDEWREVVHGVDFDVYAGRTLGIVGESGSGKSVRNTHVISKLAHCGTISNLDGVFLVPAKPVDTLWVSCLGYSRRLFNEILREQGRVDELLPDSMDYMIDYNVYEHDTIK